LFDLSLLVLSAAPEPFVFQLTGQTPIQMAINLFNVAVLAVVLSKLLYNPVRNFMAARSEKIRTQLEGAAKEAESAAALKQKYEDLLVNIDRQRDDILSEARARAGDTERRILAEAKAEADAVRERAHAEVELERERVREEMRQVIIEVSAAMTEKLVAATIDDELRERVFAETVSDLEEARWLN